MANIANLGIKQLGKLSVLWVNMLSRIRKIGSFVFWQNVGKLHFFISLISEGGASFIWRED